MTNTRENRIKSSQYLITKQYDTSQQVTHSKTIYSDLSHIPALAHRQGFLVSGYSDISSQGVQVKSITLLDVKQGTE